MIKNLFQAILDIFFISEKEITPNFSKININKIAYYKKNFQNFYLDEIFVCLDYEENLKKYLKKFKYEYNKRLYILFTIYLEEIYNKFLKNKVKNNNKLICGIPLFPLNFLKRGYNHTYILGENLAKTQGIKFLKILGKKRYTKPQAQLSKKERLENIKNSFYVKNKYIESIQNKDIILIDDVISTGSTANEAAKVLKQNGARNVYGIFLATRK